MNILITVTLLLVFIILSHRAWEFFPWPAELEPGKVLTPEEEADLQKQYMRAKRARVPAIISGLIFFVWLTVSNYSGYMNFLVLILFVCLLITLADVIKHPYPLYPEPGTVQTPEEEAAWQIQFRKAKKAAWNSKWLNASFILCLMLDQMSRSESVGAYLKTYENALIWDGIGGVLILFSVTTWFAQKKRKSGLRRSSAPEMTKLTAIIMFSFGLALAVTGNILWPGF